MSLSDYITLGRSGLRVSPICLGTMTFGTEWGWGSDVPTSNRILETYLEQGGNFIDTANMYTKGHSEKIIGDFFHDQPRKRDRAVIATKFLGGMFRGDPNGGGAHRKSMMTAVEHSLRRLQTDYIDLYWMHFWDPFTPIEETMRGLDDLVSSGKVRYIGFSDTPAWKCAQAQTIAHFRGWAPLIALQIEYSLIERTVEGELVPMALEMGLGITPWSPLKGGVLSGKYSRADAGKPPAAGSRGSWVYNVLTDRNVAIIDACAAVAKEAGATIAEVALAWLARKPGVQSIIIGARTLEQLEANCRSAKVALTEAHMRRLDEVSKPTLNFPYDFVTHFVVDTTQNGAKINGRPSNPWNLAPATDAELW
ncbi:MAG: aldo/keto reductase [Phycisphaerales bacterium]|nr:aldo/keto reductase [Phycisphaerales bacterium]